MKYGLKEEYITRITEVLAEYETISQAIVYGSRAKGNYRPASDIDIALKGEQLTIEVLNKVANRLDDLLLPYTIDLSIYNHISNSELTEHIDRVGQVLYEKN